MTAGRPLTTLASCARDGRCSHRQLMLALGLVLVMTGLGRARRPPACPPTITMEPAAGRAWRPGRGRRRSTFPAGETVELQVTTPAGPVHLATLDVAEGGYFRQAVTLPADAPAGFWELRATAADGATAVHVFEAGTAPAAVEPVAPATEAASAPASRPGQLGCRHHGHAHRRAAHRGRGRRPCLRLVSDPWGDPAARHGRR